jgi:hypothetical protein
MILAFSYIYRGFSGLYVGLTISPVPELLLRRMSLPRCLAALRVLFEDALLWLEEEDQRLALDILGVVMFSQRPFNYQKWLRRLQ